MGRFLGGCKCLVVSWLGSFAQVWGLDEEMWRGRSCLTLFYNVKHAYSEDSFDYSSA
jgi:hypothetical protein